MVRWVRTARICRAKFGPAIAWAKEVAGYVEKKHSTPEVKVFLDSFGEVGTLRWFIDYEDLGQLEEKNAAVMADQDYWKLVDNAIEQELFVDGETIDFVMKEV